jgi:hypothetical protein
MKTFTGIQIEPGYYFKCVWDESTDMATDFEEARRLRKTHEVCCDYTPSGRTAMIQEVSPDVELNRAEVGRIHAHLFENGWTMERRGII